MDFRFTPQQERFRDEIREFLREELPKYGAEGTEQGDGVNKAFSARLGQKGWIGLAWPREYGGQGLGYIDRLIYQEEMAIHAAPIGYHHVAERQIGPSVIKVGTEEQKRFFLPRIASGQCGFALGYSEPDTGSDLASVKTRADEDGDDYVINGTKIWNNAQTGLNYIWLAARTNPDVPKHRGISVFALDLALPGISISPVLNMANEPRFCVVTFDNVRVPKNMLVGQKDQGWYNVAGDLDLERAGVDMVAWFYPLFQDFLEFVRDSEVGRQCLSGRPKVRHQIAQMQIEYEVGRLLAYKVAWMQEHGTAPNLEASVSKLFGCDMAQRMARTMHEVLGVYGQLEPGSKRAPLEGRVAQAWYQAIPVTIAGGSAEIMRNIIARRGLGMPRE